MPSSQGPIRLTDGSTKIVMDNNILSFLHDIA
ncbi:hypothetical protein F441_12743 [Phytophthora nicotianae CJ01A1]|uniref:Uncharacterized protein n=4 Tax=Phytophthora nicotianae TaxID=4792 RepID=W2PXK2_PHYN3|nr:hypothetical protein PPTG_23480 [Phytophthora nicotianae INRA-310]ETL35466.1 hypothetical protein L916_12408 [Phytophthora nicotianae]ETO70654.1 hypothetical protein F444_12896 [Phytophthora nicotianae P1976]ETP11780.1 hypothetical protein F441_12743 [Phytophthora nicotianae CJ01A1]ETM41946.1 hypothetical protein L914_12327 [Phytophthora nicotianae]ETN05632.1 hypothetical protein PPTG_23480 [Phytophthora nicotianae INRA-310]